MGKKTSAVVAAANAAVEESAQGSWTKAQQPPEPTIKPGYKLVTLNERPRRVVAEVPNEVVSWSNDNEGNRVLVFDGVRCPRGVVNFHGTKCFLDGEPVPAEVEA